jgi:putative ABC transport system permease protein
MKSSHTLSEARQTLAALRETVWIALDTLRAHKLRTFLTLLGVILAVTTLVAVISVLNGLNVYVADKVANLGANAFVIDRIGIVTNQQEWFKARKRPTLGMDDLEALRNGMKLADTIAGQMRTFADVRHGNDLSEDVMIIGATPSFASIRDIDVSNGRLLTDIDEDHRAGVCVIGADVANKLFPGTDPVGKEVRAGQGQYAIVGVATPKGNVLGQPQDNFVMVPLGTYRKEWLTAQDSVTFFVQARGPEFMDAAEDEARMILRSRHHLAYQTEDNFAIIAPTSIMGLWNRITGNAFGIAIWITSVFLVVGGVVIMNIMLASVTERTHEIGIRKSLGARRQDILNQFLVESAVLAATGGLAGVIIAWGVAILVRNTTPVPMALPWSSVFIGVGLSAVVGLFFGIYPARQAARLDPIEALRAEK